MRACLYCHGLLVACGECLSCVLCGQHYTLRTLTHYTSQEWGDLATFGRIVVSGELHWVDGDQIRVSV